MSGEQKRWNFLRWLLVGIAILLFGYFLSKLESADSKPPSRTVAHTAALVIAAGIDAYVSEYEVRPTGNHAQIVALLLGDNQRKIVFLEVPEISPKGELIDPWGTPYRFDIQDGKKSHVWSYGPNRRDDGGAEGSDDIVSWR